eukprot:symbB.v1.2.027407.t1/scaffold2802.1/size122644/3
MATFGRMLQRYREASKAKPLAVAFVTCYGKGTASDLVAQMVVERKSQPSWQRNVAFALFSGAYLGVGQHFVYNVAFTRIFGAGMDLRVGVQKVLADLFGHVSGRCHIKTGTQDIILVKSPCMSYHLMSFLAALLDLDLKE